MTDRKHLGLLGKDIQRSKSPELFREFFSEAGLTDFHYELFDLSGPELIADLLQEEDLLGFNVTAPYKKEVIKELDMLSEEAARTGAVNTVVWKDNIWIGHNTDVVGVRVTIEHLALNPDRPALVMGNGGASQAVQYVLKELGFEFRVFSSVGWDHLYRYHQLTNQMVREAGLIVNATPLGKPPLEDKMPPVPMPRINDQHTLFDLNYDPPKSAFLEVGESFGARVINGDLMLRKQAEASWEIWQEAAGIRQTKNH